MIHKVGSISIFVQVIIRTNLKWPREESILSKFIFVMMLWINIQMIDNYILLIFKVKSIQNANITNIVNYMKTRLVMVNLI